MVYRGKVQNGMIVLEGAERLPEGMEVRVEPVAGAAEKPRVGSPEAILSTAGIWVGQEEEMDRSLQELREMKEEEVRRQKLEPDPEL